MEKVQLKVAGTSNPASVAGAIVKNLDEKKDVELIAVGAR
jgi:stage V sporulation protein SpoVS